MDEVDGMSSGDRGGSAELAQMIRKTKVSPIIDWSHRSGLTPNFYRFLLFVSATTSALKRYSLCFAYATMHVSRGMYLLRRIFWDENEH